MTPLEICQAIGHSFGELYQYSGATCGLAWAGVAVWRWRRARFRAWRLNSIMLRVL
jgi:hypothetical protein